MRVPMRGTGADQPVGAMKARNGAGAKGLTHLAEDGATTGELLLSGSLQSAL